MSALEIWQLEASSYKHLSWISEDKRPIPCLIVGYDESAPLGFPFDRFVWLACAVECAWPPQSDAFQTDDKRLCVKLEAFWVSPRQFVHSCVSITCTPYDLWLYLLISSRLPDLVCKLMQTVWHLDFSKSPISGLVYYTLPCDMFALCF